MTERPALRLSGKRALVTGAARGIGRAVACALAREGARVLMTDIHEPTLVEAARAIDQPCRYLDVRDEHCWITAIGDVIARFGGLDVLVNNAGITGLEAHSPPAHDPEHTALDECRSVHATNLDGVFLGCKHAIRAMRACATPAGSIVNVGSRSGVVGVAGAAAYASSKGAVRNHTKSVALYCAQKGLPIRCNVVQPAAILTPMWEPMLGEGPEREANLRRFTANCPLRRFGTPEEVAQLVVHLASNESAYTTGAEFTVDGGVLAGDAAPALDEG